MFSGRFSSLFRSLTALVMTVTTVIMSHARAETPVPTQAPLSAAHMNNPKTVHARPRVAGDTVPNLNVQDVSGNTRSLKGILDDHYTMLVFTPMQSFGSENLRAYFRMIRSYIEKLGYQIVIVTTTPTPQQRAALYERKDITVYVDPDRSSFMAMGLADSNAEGASIIPCIFFVSPTGTVLTQFASVDHQIPFSGDALVLAARVYKQIEETNRYSGVRQGPTVAPLPGGEPPPPSASSPENPTNVVMRTDRSFAMPDESVLRLLTIEDIARTNSYWTQFGVGVTAYDARRNTWSPRWSPGVQIGRRFNTFGGFLNFALDQTFDLTQEVKRLDVLHFGLGVDAVALYGRVRSSFSTGMAYLNSDTDIDSRGKYGWYFDLRPISFRWSAGPCSALELTPLSLNVSVPVTRGIPLILVGYMTTLSFEWSPPPEIKR